MVFYGHGINHIIPFMITPWSATIFLRLFSAFLLLRLIYYASLVIYNPYLIAVGIGIFCYGAFYLIFHDIIVHQRMKWRPQKRSKYLQRMIHAHYVHHSRHTKEGCEAFGFLICP